MSGRAWGWLALALALWGPVWLGCAEWWGGRPEQAHGWLVPAFALWLGRERWLDAPQPAAGGWFWPAAALAGAMALWTAGLVLLTPNGYWPTAQWLAGLGAAAGWLAAAAGAGGRRWAGHFAGAALFPLCAAAWPAVVQVPVLETLGPLLAAGAAEVVNAGGRLALAQGSVIEVTGGWVGVDEACAGLRSLDAAVMMAWFIGEQRRFTASGRVWLGAAALAAAVGGNFFRATTLVWVAAGAGPQATEAWHDTLGWAVLGLTLAGVLAAAERIERRAARPAARGSGAPADRRFASAGLALAAAGWAATVTWYSPAGYAPVRVGWELASAGAEWRAAPPPPGIGTLLDATRWEGAEGEGAGWRGLAYLIAWEGDVASAENAFKHGPELCLSGIGLRRVAEIEAVTVNAAGRTLALAGARYADATERLQYVWFARWDEAEGRVVGRGVSEASPAETRLAGVRARRRGASLAQVVLVAAGPEGDAAARRWAETWAPRLLTRVD